MELTAVLVADTRPTSVETAVEGLAAAIGEAESAGDSVQTVIVDSSADRLVRQFLDQVEGADILRAPRASRAEAALLGARAAQTSTLWISGSDTAASTSSLTRLAAAVAAGNDLALAAGDDPAPFCAMSGALLTRVADLVAGSRGEIDLVPALAEALLAEGGRVAGVGGAGARRHRQREARPIDGGTRLSVVPGTFSVGPSSYSGPNSLFRTYDALDRIEVGGYCSIADEVRLVLPGERVFDPEGHEVHLTRRGTHRMDAASSFPMGVLVPEERYDEPPRGSSGERLVVGDDVWIGYRAMVVGGVRIGTGAVVGSGAVVVSDVPAYAVVGGVPAKVLRMRFDDQTIARLLRVRWWDWPPNTVQGAHRWFSRSVAEFLRHFDPAGEPGVAVVPDQGGGA